MPQQRDTTSNDCCEPSCTASSGDSSLPTTTANIRSGSVWAFINALREAHRYVNNRRNASLH